MCKQKTDSRVYLEEYLSLYFPNRSYNIVPFHFYKTGNAVIEQDDRVIYFGSLSVGDMAGNQLFYMGRPVPFFGSYEQRQIFFSSLDFIDVAFNGYMVTFEVSLTNGEIK